MPLHAEIKKQCDGELDFAHRTLAAFGTAVFSILGFFLRE
jgi:hypothetical protein